MAKIAQLISAGDYLVYKGNWLTGTAYEQNDCVTWSTNGHMYKIVKSHTSSASIDPDNAEYYTPMTDKTFSEMVYDLSDSTSKANFFTNLNNMDNRPFVKITGTLDSMVVEFSIISVSTSTIKLQAANFAGTTVYLYYFTCNASAANTCIKVTIDAAAGTISNSSVSLSSLTVANLD